MIKNEYKKWVNRFLMKVPQKNQEFFLRIVDLGYNLRKPNVGYHIESSLNTRERFKVIKATHCFHYPKFSREKRCSDFIKSSILLNIFEKISGDFKFKFDRKILNFILSIPLSQGGKNDVIVFYVDFNSFSNQFDKISIGINPVSTQLLPTIGKTLRIKNWKLLYQNFMNTKNFLGFDFYPNNECSLKIYQEIKASPQVFRGKAREVFQQLNRLSPIKTFILLNRFRNKKLLSKDVYFRCRKISSRRLFKMSCLNCYKSFLEQVEPYIKNFEVGFIAIKDKQLEIYFR